MNEYEIMLHKRRMAQKYKYLYNYFNDKSNLSIIEPQIEFLGFTECNSSNSTHEYYKVNSYTYRCIICGGDKPLDINIEIPYDVLVKIFRSTKDLWYLSRSTCKTIREMSIPHMIKHEIMSPIRGYEIKNISKLEGFKRCYVMSMLKGTHNESIRAYKYTNNTNNNSNNSINNNTITNNYYSSQSSTCKYNGVSWIIPYSTFDRNKICIGRSKFYLSSDVRHCTDNDTKIRIMVDVESRKMIVKYRCHNIFNIYNYDTTIDNMVDKTHKKIIKLSGFIRIYKLYVYITHLSITGDDFNIKSVNELMSYVPSN